MSRKRKEKPVPRRVELYVESLDLEGQGVAHLEGKVFFVDGAITHETVIAEETRSKASYSKASVVEVIKPAATRVEPKCPHFGVCGGCAMQHIDANTQVAVKARALEDLLQRIGQHKPERVLPPLFGPTWHYRHRARLTCRDVPKKGRFLVGFREKASSYVADMDSCEILPKHVSELLPKLSDFLPTLSQAQRLPQIELAVGQDITAMVLRHLEPLTSSDLDKLRAFGAQYHIDWWLQPKGPDSAYRLESDIPRQLSYSIPSFGIEMRFRPTDFTQVNHMINDAMVYKAITLLNPSPTDRILDLFCGLGNFSLPLATRCQFVKGFEGSNDLVTRAHENARLNGLDASTEFHERNLFEVTSEEWEGWGVFDKVLVDPPRDGALEICKAIVGARSEYQPSRIVYVSCNPSTLARDVSVLCNTGPYRLKAAGVINMFPHTGHVESIALFEKREECLERAEATT